MNDVLCIMLLMVASFWADDTQRIHSVIGFFESNPSVQRTLEKFNTKEDALIGMSIIAPEIAMNCGVIDLMECQVMEMFYVEFNRADFSIGPFHMKPSFASYIEHYVTENNLKQFACLKITASSAKDIRRIRIRRLLSVYWQTMYLSAFIAYVKEFTATIPLYSSVDKLKYWATLYNSKITSSQREVQQSMKQKLFPHFAQKYNYADVALEFYNILQTYEW